MNENITTSTNNTDTRNSEETNSGTITGVSPHNQQRNLDTIRKDIIRYQENYAQSYLEIGRLLLEAKNVFGKHGEWIKWLKKNVDLSITKAQRLMKVAEKFPDKAPVPFLDYSKAYILTALPERDIEAFMRIIYPVGGKPKFVKDMTKRELETVVRNYLKSKRDKASATLPSTNSESDAGKKMNPNSLDVNFSTRLESVKSYMDELVELIEKQADDLSTRDALAAELRHLCSDIMQKLPQEELEEP